MSYIDREKLLDNMSKQARGVSIEGITDIDDLLDAMELAMRECVYNAPTEDVAPIKHGKWLWSYSNENMSCSECGEDDFTEEELYNLRFFYSKYKHCPSCGAKMDLESGD